MGGSKAKRVIANMHSRTDQDKHSSLDARRGFASHDAAAVARQEAKKAAKIRRDKIAAAYQEHRRKPSRIVLTCIGNRSCGKSTLLGQLALATDAISKKEVYALEQKARNQDMKDHALAWVYDTHNASREAGRSQHVNVGHLESKSHSITVLDTPGSMRRMTSSLLPMVLADVVLVVVDVSGADSDKPFRVTGQAFLHALCAVFLECKHFVIAVNQMESVKWSQQRFDQVVSTLRDSFKSVGCDDVKSFQFVPVSARTGDGVAGRIDARARKWYTGPNLWEAIQTCCADATAKNAISHRPHSQFDATVEPCIFPLAVHQFSSQPGAISMKLVVVALDGTIVSDDATTVFPSSDITFIVEEACPSQTALRAPAAVVRGQCGTLVLEQSNDGSTGNMNVDETGDHDGHAEAATQAHVQVPVLCLASPRCESVEFREFQATVCLFTALRQPLVRDSKYDMQMGGTHMQGGLSMSVNVQGIMQVKFPAIRIQPNRVERGQVADVVLRMDHSLRLPVFATSDNSAPASLKPRAHTFSIRHDGMLVGVGYMIETIE
jgi:translation elongation factor EF-1alpha